MELISDPALVSKEKKNMKEEQRDRLCCELGSDVRADVMYLEYSSDAFGRLLCPITANRNIGHYSPWRMTHMESSCFIFIATVYY